MGSLSIPTKQRGLGPAEPLWGSSTLFHLQDKPRDSSWKQQRFSVTNPCLSKLFQWLGLQSHGHVPTAGEVRGGCPELWLCPDPRDLPRKLLSCWDTKRGLGVSFSSLKRLNLSLDPNECQGHPGWTRLGFPGVSEGLEPSFVCGRTEGAIHALSREERD